MGYQVLLPNGGDVLRHVELGQFIPHLVPTSAQMIAHSIHVQRFRLNGEGDFGHLGSAHEEVEVGGEEVKHAQQQAGHAVVGPYEQSILCV